MRPALFVMLCVMILSGMPFFAVSSHAEGTFTYTRTNVVIMRSSMQPQTPSEPAAEAPLPWHEDKVEPENPGVIFDVEIRDGQSFYSQKGWYNLSGPSEKSGVMLMFDQPSIAPIINSAQYAPLDILMIDSQGTISQIVPNLMMAALEDDILPNSPIKAFLFLKGGTCELMNIQPGDRVLYKGFKLPPTVLSAPAQAQPMPAPVKPKNMQPLVPQPQAAESPKAPLPIPAGMPDALFENKEDAAQQELPLNQQERRRPSGPLMIPVN